MSSGLHHKITHKKKATEFFGRFYYKNEIGIYFTNLTNSGFDAHFNLMDIAKKSTEKLANYEYSSYLCTGLMVARERGGS